MNMNIQTILSVVTLSIMFDKFSLLLIFILGIMIASSLSISKLNAIAVNNTDFSIEVPNGWVYRDDFLFDNGTLLTPNEFADVLITDNASAVFDVLHGGVIAELAPDPRFPIKNAPVEIYVKHELKFAKGLAPKIENTTVGGERAIKVFINSTDIASRAGMTNVPVSLVTTSYFVMHDDQPYFLNYMANARDYQKHLPQFEQMVKSFKFTK
jgi:hypothetical protein